MDDTSLTKSMHIVQHKYYNHSVNLQGGFEVCGSDPASF